MNFPRPLELSYVRVNIRLYLNWLVERLSISSVSPAMESSYYVSMTGTRGHISFFYLGGGGSRYGHFCVSVLCKHQ